LLKGPPEEQNQLKCICIILYIKVTCACIHIYAYTHYVGIHIISWIAPQWPAIGLRASKANGCSVQEAGRLRKRGNSDVAPVQVKGLQAPWKVSGVCLFHRLKNLESAVCRQGQGQNWHPSRRIKLSCTCKLPPSTFSSLGPQPNGWCCLPGR
jgi:hypothetical protein